MADKIGSTPGINVTRDDLKRLDPNTAADADYDKIAQTLWALVNGHNEYQDRIEALEARVSALEAPHGLPFVAGSL